MLTELRQGKIANQFKVRDLNHDGVLAPMDMRSTVGASPPAGAGRQARSGSRTSNGVITADDYALLYSCGALDPALTPAAFAKIDVDRDGRVSPDELSRLLGEFFRSDDPNAPGNWLVGPF